MWNLWWVYYALVEGKGSPLDCDLLFFPWGCDLRFHTLSIMNGWLALPLTALMGSVVAYNALFVLWTFATQFFAAIWAKEQGAGRYASILLGLVAAVGAYRWNHLEHLNLFSTGWLFLAFWQCDRLWQRPDHRRAMLFTLAWMGTALTDWYYALFVGVYWGGRLLMQTIEPDVRPLQKGLPYFIFPPLALTALVMIYFSPGDKIYPANDPQQFSIVVTSFWSLDGLHLITPPWLIEALSLPVQQGSEFRLHPGLLLLLLGVWGVASKGVLRLQRYLVGVMAVFFVLSLGPLLRLGGEPVSLGSVPFFLPAALHAYLPGFDSMRVFTRFSYIGFVILALFGLARLEQWLRGYGRSFYQALLWLIVVLGFLLESQWRPLPLSHYQAPKKIATWQEGGLAEFPFEPTVMSGLHLFHQTLHQQPIYVAEFSRMGQYKEKYLQSFPILKRLNDWALGRAVERNSNIECNLLKSIKLDGVIFYQFPEKPDPADRLNEQCEEVEIDSIELGLLQNTQSQASVSNK